MGAAYLSVRTPWSFHAGASSVEQLAAAAAERKIGLLALADRNGLWGALPFQTACTEHGIRSVIGATLARGGQTARVLVADAEGYRALCRMVTRIQCAEEEETPPEGLNRLLLEECVPGLALLTRDLALSCCLRKERPEVAVHFPVRPGPRLGRDLSLAYDMSLAPVAAPEIFFAHPEDWMTHRWLRAVGLRTSLDRLQTTDSAPPNAWLKPAAEFAADYREAPHLLAAARHLGEQCCYQIPTGCHRLPQIAVPARRSAMAHLALLCERGRRRRKLAASDRFRGQLQRELNLIEEQGMAHYFLAVAEIVRFARTERISNCGRGSAANSLVSYLLGFTHVDPIRHDLYFERFMHRGRSDYPDVDIDLSWYDRDRVVDWVYRRYGSERVAMIGTHVSFGKRGALRELARVDGLAEAEIRGRRFARATPAWGRIEALAETIQNFPRHMGIHSGGILIAPGPLTDFLPLQFAAKRTQRGRRVITQWDMYAVEDAGLVKIDLLGNRGLAVIEDAQRSLRRRKGCAPDFASNPPEQDPALQEQLAQGDTIGCFYIESPAMRSLLRKLRCRDFPTLVAASSIIRPGISRSGMMRAYIERHDLATRSGGEHDPRWYAHPAMRELLGETYGVMAYQEDVLRVAARLAGFSAPSADGLRRAMSKKRAFVAIAEWKDRFLHGCSCNDIDEATASEIWRQIESFAGYSFCKAHSASYARISFQSLWLRTHYPAEFMAAVLTNGGGYYSRLAYLAEARRMGLQLHLPCINTGSLAYVGAGEDLCVGLLQIKSIPEEHLKKMLHERERGGIFRSLASLQERTGLPRSTLEQLVRAGALDRLGDRRTRAERMRDLAILPTSAGPPAPQGRLYAVPHRSAPASQEFSRHRLLALEAGALGFLVSEHPLELYRERIEPLNLWPANRLQERVGSQVEMLGWQVTTKQVQTGRGDRMAFVTFEDMTAIYETVLFPRAWKRLAPWTESDGPYLLRGRVCEEYGVPSVEVEDLELLDHSMAGAAR